MGEDFDVCSGCGDAYSCYRVSQCQQCGATTCRDCAGLRTKCSRAVLERRQAAADADAPHQQAMYAYEKALIRAHLDQTDPPNKPVRPAKKKKKKAKHEPTTKEDEDEDEEEEEEEEESDDDPTASDAIKVCDECLHPTAVLHTPAWNAGKEASIETMLEYALAAARTTESDIRKRITHDAFVREIAEEDQANRKTKREAMRLQQQRQSAPAAAAASSAGEKRKR